MADMPEKTSAAGPTNVQTIVFMVVLSFICALILSTLASALRTPQELAKEFDRSQQMLIAARIINPLGYFQIETPEGNYIPAKYEQGKLVPGKTSDIPSQKEVLEIYRSRIDPFLIDSKGEVHSFAQAGLDEQTYTQEYRKSGYYQQPLKLIYKINPNTPISSDKGGKETKPEGYVIPINGFGLWDAIYGYLAIKPDGNSVIGISWYDQKETPGLGGVISEPGWQSLFPGKKLFQANPDGKTDFSTAQLGLIVVKGKVNEVYGSTPKAQSAIDGMAGATLTGNGVTSAYKDVLMGYRPFLEKLAKDKGNIK